MTNPPVALTVAGTDSGGAAGVAADLATFGALGTHGACVVTAVTAQDTTGVHDVHPIPQATIDSQLDAVFDDLPVAAVKSGMLGSAEAVVCLSTRIAGFSGARPALVVDPVLVATSGSVLGDDAVRDAYVSHLLPVATVATPNLDEARSLAGASGLDVDLTPERLAAALTEICPAVVLTGGPDGVSRLAGARTSTTGGIAGARTSTTGGLAGARTSTTVTDWVAVRGEEPVPLVHPAVPTSNDHGTGCTFSAAVAALLAYPDHSATPASVTAERLRWIAVRAAEFTTGQLHTSRTWTLGRGRGPIAHTSAPPHHPEEMTHDRA
jgi:hydroxymethylpyrimidine/phosphomethylpyrimidine kinase